MKHTRVTCDICKKEMEYSEYYGNEGSTIIAHIFKHPKNGYADEHTYIELRIEFDSIDGEVTLKSNICEKCQDKIRTHIEKIKFNSK